MLIIIKGNIVGGRKQIEQLIKDFFDAFNDSINMLSDNNKKDINSVDKKEYYYSDNVLVRSFNEKSYSNNPKFLSNEISKYPFKPYSEFGKQGVDERQRLYYLLDEDIYKVDYLREISGFWDEEYNQLLTRNKLQDSSNLDIFHVNIELSAFKKPLFIELDGNKIECNSFADMVVKVVNYLIIVNHEGITFLARQNFCNRINYLGNDDKKEQFLGNMISPKEISDSRIFLDAHASAKDLMMFVRQFLFRYELITLSFILNKNRRNIRLTLA